MDWIKKFKAIAVLAIYCTNKLCDYIENGNAKNSDYYRYQDAFNFADEIIKDLTDGQN